MARHTLFVSFCCSAALALLGWAFPGAAQDNLPDGGQAKDMIDGNTQKAIDAGLSYLANSQHADGSFGTGQQTGNVADRNLVMRNQIESRASQGHVDAEKADQQHLAEVAAGPSQPVQQQIQAH